MDGLESCSYCKPKNAKTLLAGKAAYMSAWVQIYTNDSDVRLGLSAKGESDIGNSVEIFYCPMCGRKLSGKNKTK
ncbi:hypothetical protein [Paenibacillus sp. NAIST15-1]|uniref:hypothetical protein n=1 Tax=Paenibacillus sp. NAIST15-1 TaxID=1605994 RepID=UPI00086E1F75|nr:hypothetical protein [Paenibacillus sp. NAIST15-1]GAV11418.1 Gp59 [Paenibacillus sp. NAIST15-1]